MHLKLDLGLQVGWFTTYFNGTCCISMYTCWVLLGIKEPYVGAYFGHPTDGDKVCKEMTKLSLRSAQVAL